MGRNVAGARAIESMPRSWRGWGRTDPKSLHPIQHRSTEVREDLLVLRARDALVKSRTELINSVRGLVESMVARISGCSSFAFSQKAAAQIPEGVQETLQLLLRLIATLNDEIKTFDQRIEKLAADKYMHTQLLFPHSFANTSRHWHR
jgi:transposase